jgi:site-specific recombinase XerD
MESEVNAFLANIEQGMDYSKSTRLAYDSDLRVFLAFVMQRNGSEPKIADFNEDIIRDFLRDEVKTGRRRNTIIRRLATLRRFEKYLETTGAKPVGLPHLDEELLSGDLKHADDSDATTILSSGQTADLLAVMENSIRPRAQRDQAILMLLLETGISVGNLTSLDIVDIDPDASLLHLQYKVGQDGWFSMGSAGRYVERYVTGSRLDLIRRPDEPALFVSQMDGRLSRQGIWQILNHWGRAIDPPLSISPRLLRNTAACRMLQAGKSMSEIQTLLGHHNPLSTRALARRLDSRCRKS